MASFIRKLSRATVNLNLLKNGSGRLMTCRRFDSSQFGSAFSSGPSRGSDMKTMAPSSIATKEEFGDDQSPDDILYKRLEVEVRGHDAAVLKSYEWFATTAAKHLGITVSKTWAPKVDKMRRRALKSAFAHGKHIVQYEFRTYFRVMEMVKMTGSTADTYLEYIQRNLPEGVAMKVTKERLEKIPPHIRPPIENNL